MWNERKMPERWYGLLRERMQIEEQRMRVIRDGGIVDNDYQEDLLAQADSLDRDMLLVMRQAIAAALERDLVREAA
jgi:dUTPase